MKALITILLLTFLANQGKAQETINSDRPGQSDGSTTIKKDQLQLETGIQHSSIRNNGITEKETIAPLNLIRYGITSTIEIRLINQYVFEKNQSGFSDTQVGTKIQLYNKEDKNTQIAYLGNLTLPSGSFTTDTKVKTMHKIALSHNFTPSATAGINIGYYNYSNTQPEEIAYSIYWNKTINSKTSFFVEFYETISFSNTTTTNADTGFAYLIRSNIQIDFYYGVGLNHSSNFFATGLSWRLE